MAQVQAGCSGYACCCCCGPWASLRPRSRTAPPQRSPRTAAAAAELKLLLLLPLRLKLLLLLPLRLKLLLLLPLRLLLLLSGFAPAPSALLTIRLSRPGACCGAARGPYGRLGAN